MGTYFDKLLAIRIYRSRQTSKVFYFEKTVLPQNSPISVLRIAIQVRVEQQINCDLQIFW